MEFESGIFLEVCRQESKDELTAEIDGLKKEIDSYRPFDREREQRVMQKLRLEWNYHSNAIEGNKLDYGETVAFLMHGLTAQGKPLKDHLDIRGHNEAINLLQELVRQGSFIYEKDIRDLHRVLLVEPYQVSAEDASGNPVKKTIKIGEYKSMPNHVRTQTGEMHFYASPEETPALMTELMAAYQKGKEDKSIHPVVLAALVHHRFAAIHPFDDGNGRTARLLMNLILMEAGFPPAVIRKEEREKYYFTLSQADNEAYAPFIEYVASGLLRTLKLQLKGVKGESLEEASDFDKKFALLQTQIGSEKDKVRYDLKVQKEVAKKVIEPLFSNARVRLEKVSSLFERWVVAVLRNGSGRHVHSSEVVRSFNDSTSNGEIIHAYSVQYRWMGNKFGEKPVEPELKIDVELKPFSFSIHHRASLGNAHVSKTLFKGDYSSFPEAGRFEKIASTMFGDVIDLISKAYTPPEEE